MSLEHETETLWLAPKLKRFAPRPVAGTQAGANKVYNDARLGFRGGWDDAYLFFVREVRKEYADVTIVDQVSTRIKHDADNLA